jgi:hypothetical protein
VPTRPVRVDRETYEELQASSRLLGLTPAGLLRRAWETYKETPEFREQFEWAQKAFAVGDIDALTRMLDEQADRWAESAVSEIRKYRRD